MTGVQTCALPIYTAATAQVSQPEGIVTVDEDAGARGRHRVVPLVVAARAAWASRAKRPAGFPSRVSVRLGRFEMRQPLLQVLNLLVRRGQLVAQLPHHVEADVGIVA